MNKLRNLKFTFVFNMCIRNYSINMNIKYLNEQGCVTVLSSQKVDINLCNLSCGENEFDRENIKIENGNIKENATKCLYKDQIKNVNLRDNLSSDKIMLENVNLTKNCLDYKTEIMNINEDLVNLLNNNMIAESIAIFRKTPSNGSKQIKFELITKLLSILSKESYVEEIKYIKSIVLFTHTQEYMRCYEFDHYLAASLFYSGHEEEALKLLDQILPKYPIQSEITNKICSIMSEVPNLSELLQKQVCDWTGFLCQRYYIYEPAYVLWSHLFKNDNNLQNMLAWRILRNQEDLLRKPSTTPRFMSMIEEACYLSNVCLLHRIIAISPFYKDLPNMKLVLQNVISALLTDYCIAGNCQAADDLFSYAQSEQINFAPSALLLYARLLSDLNKPSPLYMLLFKYGLRGIKIKYASKKGKYTNIKSILEPEKSVKKKFHPIYKF